MERLYLVLNLLTNAQEWREKLVGTCSAQGVYLEFVSKEDMVRAVGKDRLALMVFPAGIEESEIFGFYTPGRDNDRPAHDPFNSQLCGFGIPLGKSWQEYLRKPAVMTQPN